MVSILSADDALFYSFFVIGPVGLAFNALLLIIIFRKKALRQKEYMIFVHNRGFMDTAMCLQFIILQPWAVASWSTNPIWCKVAAGAAISTMFAIIVLEPVLALNRYVAICRHQLYQRVYQKRYVYLMCASAWLLGALVGLVDGLVGSLGKIPGLLCIAKMEGLIVQIAFALCNYPILFICYATMFYCYWKIYKFLKEHQNRTLSNGEQTNLQEDKSLLRYIACLGVLPVATEFPVIVLCTVHLIDNSLALDYYTFASTLILMMCPVINPILTLYVVRPIRQEFLRVIKCLTKDGSTTTPVVQVDANANRQPTNA